MDPWTLSAAAKSYDFAEAFIRPSAAEMSAGAGNVPNFGILLSTILQERFVVKWSMNKFDPVSYFLHFFLGVTISMQQSDEMRANFNIDKVFWTLEKDNKLKMYISTRGESENKLIMKCLTFGNGKPPHDWSQKDFLDVASKLGPEIESYKIESHHYNAEFKKEVTADGGGEIGMDGFFITADYKKSMKIDPSLIQKGKKASSKHLKEIKPLEGKAVDIERFFRGMLTEPERADLVRTSAKDFCNHIIENFRNNFKATLQEAQFGFMHGTFLPYQKKYDFLAHPTHIANAQSPTAQYSIYLEKKFTESWKGLMPDYPVVFHIVDSKSDGSRKKIENRISEVMIGQSDATTISLPHEPLASEALVNYVNFNAKENTVIQKDFSTQPIELLQDFRKQLTEIAPLLPVENDAKNFQRRRDMEKKIKLVIEKGILSGRLKNSRLEKSGNLLSYLHGFFSSRDKKAYIVKHNYAWLDERRPQTRFLLETDNKHTQVMLCVHETDKPGDVTRQMIMNDEALAKAPALNKDSKFVSVIHAVVPYTEDAVSGKIPDVYVISFSRPVEWNEKFNFEPILQLDVASKTVVLSERGEFVRHGDEVKEIIQSKEHLLRNFESFKAFALGCFHDTPIFRHLVPNSDVHKQIYIGYISKLGDGREQKIVIAHFSSEELAGDRRSFLYQLAAFRAEVEKYIPGKTLFASYSLIKDQGSDTRTADVYSENDLPKIKLCSRSKRATLCEVDETLGELEHEIDPIGGDEEKLMTSDFIVSKKLRFFNKLGQISSGVMTGLMMKSLITDIAQGNIAGIATNLGFIIASIGTSRASKFLIEKAGKFTKEGKMLMAGALKTGASFVTRSASFLFVGYDLYTNLHSNDTSTERKVAIGADYTYLALDLAESSIEVAEAIGIIEGVSAVSGPIFWTVGAAALVGTEVYRAVKQVEQIMALVPLTGGERLVEGLRAFIGLGPSRHVNDKMGLEANNKIMQRLLPSLAASETIKRYVTPIKLTQYCEWDKYIDLNAEVSSYPLSEATPSLKKEFTYFCATSNRNVCHPSKLDSFLYALTDFFKYHQHFVEKHMCVGVVAIENLRNGTANHTYYELTDGRDYVRASKNHPNIFEIGNGQKDIVGGYLDDVFLLIGNRIMGRLDGSSGSNLLSLARCTFNGTINVTDGSLIDVSNVEKSIPMVRISNFDQIHGRPGLSENVQVWCSLYRLNTLGGSKLAGPDRIFIPFSTTCAHQLTMTIASNTEVDNKALYGHFQYHIKEIENGRSNISIHSWKKRDSQHLITFEYNLFDFSSVRIHYDSAPIELVFTRDESSSLTIKAFSLENFKIAFKDGVQFHLHRKHLVAVLTTAQNLTMIENFYADIISASTISMIIHSELTNETLTLSRGRHHGKDGHRSVNIHYSDKDGKSHFKGNNKQNIFAITPYFQADCAKFHDVSIHVKEGSKNLIDFTHVRRAAVGLSSDVTFKVVAKHPEKVIIYALYTNESGTVHCDRNIGQVKVNIKHSRNLVLMNKGPLRLTFRDNQPYLESPPIHFDQSKNIIILSDHDIEQNTEMIIDKNLGQNYTFYAQKGTLLVTNVLQTNDSCEMLENVSNESVAVFIMDYTSSKAMQSIVLKFNDVSISVKDNMEGKVGAWEEFAASFDVMECIWRSILRLPALEGAIVELNTPAHDQQSERQNSLEKELETTLAPDDIVEHSTRVHDELSEWQMRLKERLETTLAPDDEVELTTVM